MSRTYKAQPGRNPAISPIPAGRLAIVLADARSGCFSPALSSSLSTADSPAALANMRDGWIQALVAHGIEPLKAAMFAMREESRVSQTLRTAGLRDRFDTLSTPAMECAHG